MALIACTECGTQISDKAAACVKCGAPVKPLTVKPPMVTTQQTSKRYKAAQAVGVLAMIVGAIAVPAGSPAVAGIGLFGGLVVYLAARAGAWWNNG